MTSNKLIEQTRLQIEQWIRRQHHLADDSAIPEDLLQQHMSPAQRGLCPDDAPEMKELIRMTERFSEHSGSVLIPCTKQTTHVQPCICPFQWYCIRKSTTDYYRTKKSALVHATRSSSDSEE